MAPTRTTRTAAALLAAALTVAVTAGCNLPKASGGTQDQPRDASPLASGANAPVPPPGTCKLGSRDGQPLPDPKCTPGAINPAVTQDNIKDTICKSGWTKTVRPPVSKTNRLKQQIDQSYGLPTNTEGELDHLASLELGGAPDDPRNLWVEPGKIPNPKDAVENKLNKAVCSGLIPLAVAQQAIASDWVTAFDASGLRISGGKVCLAAQPSRCANGRHGDSD